MYRRPVGKDLSCGVVGIEVGDKAIAGLHMPHQLHRLLAPNAHITAHLC